jgi:hypothetical protein
MPNYRTELRAKNIPSVSGIWLLLLPISKHIARIARKFTLGPVSPEGKRNKCIQKFGRKT